MSDEKQCFIDLIDITKNKMVDPVAMLHFTWLRVFLLQIPDKEFDAYLASADKELRK